jgi:hypothetical protein
VAKRKKRAKRKRAAPAIARPKLRKVTLQTQTAPGAGYKRVCEIARKLPGVEEVTWHGTPGLKVKGRIMGRLRTEAEGALAIRCDFVDRQILMQADPSVFFVTDHYLNYPMVLVRLEKIRRSVLPDLIERAWRMVAPPKLVAEYDASRK